MIDKIQQLYKSQLEFIIEQLIREEAGEMPPLERKLEVKPRRINYEAVKVQLSRLWDASPAYRGKIEQWIDESISRGDQQQVIAMDPVTGMVSVTAIVYFYKISEKILEKLTNLDRKATDLGLRVLRKPEQAQKDQVDHIYNESLEHDTRRLLTNQTDDQDQVDIVILTVVNAEYDAVVKHLEQIKPVKGYAHAIYSVGDYWGFRVAVRRIPEQGNVSMAVEAERAMRYFNPSLAFLVGLAGGLRPKLTIGDVVIAGSAFYYESGKETASGFRYRPKGGSSNFELKEKARYLADNLTRFWDEEEAPDFKALTGTIVAGEKVVASNLTRLYEDVKLHNEDALALSMEGFGLLKALEGHESTMGLEIRGISDMITHGNKDDIYFDGGREKAAENAGRFVFRLIRDLRNTV